MQAINSVKCKSVDEYMRSHQKLSLDCNFKIFTADTYRNQIFLHFIHNVESKALAFTSALNQDHALRNNPEKILSDRKSCPLSSD